MTLVLVTLVGAVLCGVLYRMGGSDTYGTKWRDFGVPTVVTPILGAWTQWHWSLALCWLLLFASLTTYFKRKGSEARWWNWALVGLAVGLSTFPLALATGEWLPLALRCALLAVLVPVWSCLVGNAVVEELGRGFLIGVTLLVLSWRRKK